MKMYSFFTLIQIIISRLCIDTCRMDTCNHIYIYIYNVKNNIINKIKQLVIDFDIFFFFTVLCA